MTALKYLAPATLKEACALLLEHRDARVIAGGTDLVVQMKQGEARPGCVINIAAIAGQDAINYTERDGLRLGALVTMTAIRTSPIINQKYNILSQAAGKLGTWQVQNRATIGGNLCNAATSADTIPALLALDASAVIVSAKGEREVPVEDFFTGPGKTILSPGELVAGIRVPPLPPHSGGVYLKHTVRKALDLAIIGVGAVAVMDGDIFKDVRIALGTAAPKPIRARNAEAALRGRKMDDNIIEQAASAAVAESSPRDSLRATAEYRRELIAALVARAVRQAAEQAG
ncbi:MAG: xanthine dehydrogenase family protein subunit M [Chloroflexi bacterium]|nr:xanthine dehydrogenase family protein subunit M [Chloroflexota bacterium]